MWVRIPPQPQRSTQDVERGLCRMENLNFGLYITYIVFAEYMIDISIPIIFGCISKVKANKINRAATLRLCRSYTEKSEVIETRS